MTKRNIVHIEIPAADQAKAAKFYQALFGWKTTRDEKMNYTMWEPAEGPGGGFAPLGDSRVVARLNPAIFLFTLTARISKPI